MKILTSKTTRARLLKYIQRVLKNQRPVIIIVTGSMGKTTTHVAVAQVVSAKYRTKVITTNDNNGRGPLLGFFGMSLPQKANSKKFWIKALARAYKMSIKFPYEAVVLEISDSAYGSLKDFLEMINADYCVVTGVAKVHMKKFETEERLLEDIKNIGLTAKKVIYNADFPQLEQLYSSSRAMSYGTKKGDFTYIGSRSENSTLLQNNIAIHNKPWIQYPTKSVASHALYAHTAAAIVGNELGVSRQKIIQELKALAPLKGRLNVFEGIRGSTVIDDTYNANAESMIAAVSLLKDLPGTKVVVLGSINELGGFAKQEHVRVGSIIAQYPDEIYLFGSDAVHYLAPALLKAGFNKNNLNIFKTSREAGTFLAQNLKEGSVVIAKGSQNDIFTEEAIKPILRNDEDKKLLVRQSQYWIDQKNQSFDKQEANLENY